MIIDYSKSPEVIKNEILSKPEVIQDLLTALWFSQPHVLADMRPKSLPTPPPKWVEYQGFNPSTKSKMNKNAIDYAGFWREMSPYLSERSKIIDTNWRNTYWLKWARMILIRNNEPEAAQRVLETLSLHQEEICEQPAWS